MMGTLKRLPKAPAIPRLPNDSDPLMPPQSPPRFLPGCPPDPATLTDAFSHALVAWFRAVARDFPWRRGKDAYAIWISEVMLQQTTTTTVIPYFERFMREYPNLHSLASANEEAVLRMWEGLGYYRRCRALLAAARQLVGLGHGNVPDDPELLGSLPGMGEYTRNAVLSQAFGRAVPIIEANSRRVLARVFGLEDDASRPPCSRWLWDAAAHLVPAKDSGAYNQALMELGSLVCTPAKPSCLVCPARRWCRAAGAGAADRIPLKAPRPAITKVSSVGLALRSGGAWLLRQCPPGGRREGLWEFPHHPIGEDESPIEKARDFLAELACQGADLRPAGRHDHSVTRYRVSIHLFAGELDPMTRVSSCRWVAPDDMEALPMSAPHRRIWKHLRDEG